MAHTVELSSEILRPHRICDMSLIKADGDRRVHYVSLALSGLISCCV